MKQFKQSIFKSICLVAIVSYLFTLCPVNFVLADDSANSPSAPAASPSSSPSASSPPTGESSPASTPSSSTGAPDSAPTGIVSPAETSPVGDSPANAETDSPDAKNEADDPDNPEPDRPGTEGQYKDYTQTVNGFNFSMAEAFQTDLFTGSANFSLPIVVPPGRQGLEPSLSLTYSSQQKDNGLYGVGWNLAGLGTIERSTKNGPPQYDNNLDVFLFNSPNGAGELVAIGNNDYFSKIESGFTKFTFNTNDNSWLATSKDGAKYFFGQTIDTRQGAETTINGETTLKTFQWQLDKVIDVNGNYLTITYFKDKNQIYPQTIAYTGFGSETNLNGQVEFVFEDRLDTSLNYRSTFSVETTKRLKEILIKKGDGQLIRKYGLKYNGSPLTLRSQLISAALTQYGSDGSELSLPAMTFKYADQGDSFDRVDNFKMPITFTVGSNGGDNGVRLADVNGDGLVDVLQAEAQSNNGFMTWLNNGLGFVQADNFKMPKWFTNYGVDQGTRLADVNADGLVDVVYASGQNWTYPQTFLNNGLGFVVTDQFRMPVAFTTDYNGRDNGVRLADVNGDGLTDVLYAAGDNKMTWLNNGSSFVLTDKFIMPITFDGGNSGGDQGVRLADVNGDGLTDVVYADDGNGVQRQTWLNNGSKFVATDDFRMPVGFVQSNDNENGVRLEDVNGDGLPDVLFAEGNQTVPRTWLNNGSNFVESNNFKMPTMFTLDSRSFDRGVRLADVNGDGLPDVLRASDSNDPCDKATWLNDASSPDLLIQIDNGLGGTTDIQYAPSTKFKNTGNDDLSDLSFPIYAVSSFTQSDGQGNQYTHTYQYQDGLYDWSQKELRGFGYVKEIDPDQNYIEHYFKQDDIFKGKEYLTLTKDQNNNLFNKTENTWQSKEAYPRVNFVSLKQTDNYFYDGDSSFKQTRVAYTYDNYGNATKIDNLGDVSANGDEKTIINAYLYNPNLWLMACQRHTALYYNGKRSAWTWFYHDNNGSVDGVPTKCQVTKQSEALINPLTNTETRVDSKYIYDVYGNQTKATDPLGNSTTTTYDDQLHTYPVKITNPLNQTNSFTYDYALGQVLTSTDQNNQVTKNVYDALGRISKVIGPLDTDQYPAEIYEYDLNVKPIKTTKQVKYSYNYNLEPNPYYLNYAFTDGLGRTIETKTPAEDDPNNSQKRQIVSGLTKYDSRGLVKEKFHPYFVPESDSYSPPDYNQPYFSFDYDAMGRLVKTTNPDGTFSTLAYNDWSMTATDENNHSQTNHYDAYQRLIKVEENNLGQTYATTYAYDAQDNLVKITDNQNNISQYWYDSLNRKLKMSDPDLGIWTYEYDNNGNLIKQTDAKNQPLYFYYDKLNRITKKRYDTTALSVYVYDDTSKPYGIGRLSSETYYEAGYLNGGCNKHFYDALGREITTINNVYDSGYYTTSRAYDALNRVTSITYPDRATVIKYIHGPQGIEQVKQGSTYLISRTDYTPTSQISKINYGGTGTTTLYTYNPQTLRLQNILTKNNTTGIKLQDLTYTFDNVGNIKTIADAINTNSQTFTYDDLDRLTQAIGSYGTQAYEYDSIGNITKKAGVTLTYGTSQPHAPKTYGTTQMTYDANGNLITKVNGQTSQQYTYDVDNRLVKAEDRTGATVNQTTQFTYNNNGERVKKINSSTGDKTTYLSNLYEIDSNGTTRKHLFAGVNRFLTISTKTSVNSYGYYHSDHLGSSNVITDQTGAQVSLTEYNPWGLTAKQIGTYNAEFKFNGKELDDATGLYYYGARYYDTQTGKFTQADPAQFDHANLERLKQQTSPNDPSLTNKEKEEKDKQLQQFLSKPQNLNPYSYVVNNPLKYVDPTGKYFLPWDYSTDILSFCKSLSDFQENRGWLNTTSLVLDGFGVALPVVPATGSVLKGGVKGVNYLTDLYKESGALKIFEKSIKNGQYAINDSRFLNYILNMEHAVGKHKAILFEKVLGYNKGNADLLIQEIKSNLDNAQATLKETTKYGTTFSLDMIIKGVNGQSANIRTGWIIDKGSEIPRLITAFINK